MKDLCGKIINKWSRPIFKLQSDFSALSKDERISRDRNMADRVSAAHRAEYRRAKREAEMKAAKELKPGDPGWIPRARVPMPDTKEYVTRPEWQSHVDMSKQRKKGIDLFEKHKRKFSDRKKLAKANQAVQISIEGKNMCGY